MQHNNKKKLYFVQHGAAYTKNVDEKRPLSDNGSAEVKKVAIYLKNHKVVIKKIYHSKKLRAAQTATIFSDILAVDYVSELSGMNPNDDPHKLIKQITEDAIMYVGHLPNIQNVVANIITNSNNTVVKFQNAAVVCIEIDNSMATIKWFITPNLC